jgi:hypothetical protein
MITDKSFRLNGKTFFHVFTNGWPMGCIHYKMNQGLCVHT